MVWVPLVRVTVPERAVKVPELVQLPETFILVPAVNVPAVNVTFPLIFNVAGAVKLPVVSVRLLMVSVTVLPPVLRSVPAVLVRVTL